jgi:hypothetical protein
LIDAAGKSPQTGRRSRHCENRRRPWPRHTGSKRRPAHGREIRRSARPKTHEPRRQGRSRLVLTPIVVHRRPAPYSSVSILQTPTTLKNDFGSARTLSLEKSILSGCAAAASNIDASRLAAPFLNCAGIRGARWFHHHHANAIDSGRATKNRRRSIRPRRGNIRDSL